MANPQLTAEQLNVANLLLADIRSRLEELSGSDPELLFALRRKVAKELGYDERSKPMARRALKRRMAILQDGLCAECRKGLPATYNVLDRHSAIGGYVEANVRLLCEACDREVQRQRRYT
jgi:hypothetical protein